MKTNRLTGATCAFLFLVTVLSAGGQQQPTEASVIMQPQTAIAPQVASATTPPRTAVGEPYDYYLLTLSWSPEFCATHADNPQCPVRPGFVVHGLWPENDDGSYPKDCPIRAATITPAMWTGVIPTEALAQHEWETHGVCTPFDAATFFGLVRKAFSEVKIPVAFLHATQEAMEPPAEVVAEFAKINSGFPAGSITLSCGNNRLTAITVCLDKSLNPVACRAVRTCRANVIKITPQ